MRVTMSKKVREIQREIYGGIPQEKEGTEIGEGEMGRRRVSNIYIP
jgi:hypothetical protein